MNEQNFYELFGEIDPEIIAAADRPVPLRKKRGFIIALIAAVLAFAILLAPLAVAFTAVGGYVSFKGGIGPAINGAVDSVVDILDNTDAPGGMLSELLDVDWQGVADAVSPDGNVNWDAFFSALRGEKAEPSSDGNVYKSVKLNDGTVKIVEFISGSDQTVIEVPEKIGGATVTVIGKGAFKGNDFITHVSLPDSVTKIEKSAFEDCSSLITIDLPDNLRTIDDKAFAKCSSLTLVDLPYMLNTIGEKAFMECKAISHIVVYPYLEYCEGSVFYLSGLQTAEFSEGVTTVYGNVFNDSPLTEVILPSTVTTIEEFSFYSCKQLSSIKLNEGLIEIKGFAFSETAINEVILPSTVTTIGESAFSSCVHLSSVTLNEGLKEIKAFAFSSAAITEVILPSTLTELGEYAFSSCMHLSSVTLNEGLKEIKAGAFSATAITELIIPSTVTMLGSLDFSFCPNFKKLIFMGNAPSVEYVAPRNDDTPDFTVYYLNSATGFSRGMTSTDQTKWHYRNCQKLLPEITQPIITDHPLYDAIPPYKSTVLRGGFRQTSEDPVILIDSYKEYQEFKAMYVGEQSDFEYDRSYFEYFSIVLIQYTHPSSEQIIGLAGLASSESFTSGFGKASMLSPVITVDAGLVGTEDIVQTYITAQVMKSDLEKPDLYSIYVYNLNPAGTDGICSYPHFPVYDPPICID